MKILILSLGFGLKEHNLFGPLSETFIELANLGHQLVVISRDKNSQSAENEYFCDNGGSIKVIKLTQPIGLKKYLFPIMIYRQMKTLHKIYAFDLVYSHIITFMTIPALFFKTKYQLKHIYWICSDWIPEKRFWKMKFNKLLQQNIQKYTDIVLTCTEYCKNNDHNIFGTNLSKYRILPNSVNLERYNKQNSKVAEQFLRDKHKIDDSKKIILYFSSLSFRKGAIHLASSIKYISKERKDFVVLFCGPGDNSEIDRLTTMLENENLIEFAIFAGPISTADAPIYYSGCDIFCVVPEYEGFGRVFVEASAAKKPIVGSNIGGIPEIIKDKKDGLLVTREDHKQIAKSIIYLLDNPIIAKEYAQSAYSNVLEKYDVRKVAKEMERIFLEVVNG